MCIASWFVKIDSMAMEKQMTVHSGYADRLIEIQPFKTMKLFARAQELEAQGCDVVHMEVGEPDFATPAPIIAAGQAALAEGKTRYTSARGILELRVAIAGLYQSRYQLDVDPECIFITAGASGALALVSALLLNRGDGLLMTDPGYPCYRHFMRAFHGEGQLVPVTADTNYQLTVELVENNWRSNTRGVLLASPANPTGAVIDDDILRGISDLVEQKGGYLVVDEIYHGLTYGENKASGSCSALEINRQSFILSSFSKYFGMTGWRLGWLVAPAAAVTDLEKLAQNLFICPSTIAQYAALAGFSEDAEAIMESHRATFHQRRDYLVAGLRQLGFSVPQAPAVALYVYARLPDGVGPSEQFCHRLLEEFKVAATPGTDFGFFQADDHVRFTYAEDIDRLGLALERIKNALEVMGQI